MKIRPVILVLLLLLGSIFLFTTNIVQAQVVINEIGAYEPSGYEWLEIFNTGSEVADLSGWKFFEDGTNHGLAVSTTDSILDPGEYGAICQDEIKFLEKYPAFLGSIFDSAWGSLNESGEEIGLKDSEGNWVENLFIYPEAGDFSLERINSSQEASNLDNWHEHLDGNSLGVENYWSTHSLPVETPTTTPTSTITINSGFVINEIYSDPTTSTENEWIEIYNISTSSLDFTGWTLSEAGGTVLTTTTIVEAGGFLVLEFSSSKLNNDGDTITLKNPNDEIVDQVIYGSGGNSAPAKGNSLARSIDGTGEFIETTSLTPGTFNNIISPVATTLPPSGGGSSGTPSITYQVGDIVINELVSDPGDDKNEFIELYNRTGQIISLSGWWLEDGSESKTALNGNISPNSFFVVENPKGNLNNGGDMIILFAPNNIEIDQVTYGTWDDGNTADNAPRADDPYSLARKVDGQDSNNDFYDFVFTSTITTGKSNIISSFNEDGEKIEQILVTSKIIINEIYPNPPGADTEEEFIELYNLGQETVDLKDWALSDSSARKYKITGGNLSPGAYLVFKRKMTGIALNNTGGDEVKLYLPNGSLADNVKYSGSAPEGQSYARQENDSFVWTTRVTPENKNIIEGKSAEPIVVIEAETEVATGEEILFDASDTISFSGQEMKFNWDFGNGEKAEGIIAKYAFYKAGIYTVKLIVEDSDKNKVEKKIIITVKDAGDFVGGYFGGVLSGIKISEFLPNPIGSDEAEFIEFFNSGAEEVDLSGLKLDDEEGGSRAYTISEGTIIGAGQYLVFGKQETKLALNNTSDAVRLFYPDGTIITEVFYENVPEGGAYVQDNDDHWLWTSVSTPGEANIIAPIIGGVTSKVSTKSKYEKPLVYTTLNKIHNMDVGDLVEVEGVVAVTPGVFSTQYFYIVSSTSSSLSIPENSEPAGVQVYMNKKDWPTLLVGDVVDVSGEISLAYGETRIKLSSRENIKILGHDQAPTPFLVKAEEVGEGFVGALIQVKGEITEIKSSHMYVDDGSEEVKVYFKNSANINKKNFQLGDIVEVTGLLGRNNSGLQLLPRSNSDIIKIGVSEEFIAKIENLNNNKEKSFAETYLTVTAGGLTSILLGLGARARGKIFLSLIKKIGKIALSSFLRGPKV